MYTIIYKLLLKLLAAMILFVSCTEIYIPDINSGAEALVVEGLITNQDGPFTVKLSKTNLYNATDSFVYVGGAKLTIRDIQNHNYTLTDNGKGCYISSADFKPVVGNRYTLRIETVDGNIYESKPQELMPPLSYDSIYGVHTSNEYIGQDNLLKSVIGSDILLNLFKSVVKSDSFPLCRFSPTITVQYEYRESSDSSWFWVHKCWRSLPLNATENITIDKSHSASACIVGHLLGFTPVMMEDYGLSKPQGYAGIHYYLRINQYSINRDTYDFYNDAIKQMTSSGKIFDPISSQLKGNLRCINNPSEIVLGFFEASSVTHSAIVIYQNLANTSVSVFKVPYINISNGEVMYKQVKKGEVPTDENGNILSDYVNITPIWWTHF